MNTLAEEGLVLFAGPLAGSERGRIRVLLIAGAPNEAEMVVASPTTRGKLRTGS